MGVLKHIKDFFKSAGWTKIERALLISTFICTLVVTVYSVRTSRRALEQLDYALRPWISIPSVHTYFESDRMETKFEIVNIGQLPAYVKVQGHGFLDGERIGFADSHKPDTVSVLLPGQRIWYAGMGVKGDTYDRIAQGNTFQSIMQEIQVDYGTERTKMDLYTRQKIRFDNKDLPKIKKNTDRPGLWDVIDANFK